MSYWIKGLLDPVFLLGVHLFYLWRKRMAHCECALIIDISIK